MSGISIGRNIAPRMRALVVVAAAAMLFAAAPACAQDRELLIAEPVHVMGYLPFYTAIHKGFFAEEGIKVRVVTLLGGAAHTNAVQPARPGASSAARSTTPSPRPRAPTSVPSCRSWCAATPT